MQLMTISEAARRLGYKSRSQLYRLINNGYLHEHVYVQQHTGQRLVEIEGLRVKLQCICQWRPNSVFLRQVATKSTILDPPGCKSKVEPPYAINF